MEKPHTGLDDRLNMLQACFRKRMPAAERHACKIETVMDCVERTRWVEGRRVEGLSSSSESSLHIVVVILGGNLTMQSYQTTQECSSRDNTSKNPGYQSYQGITFFGQNADLTSGLQCTKVAVVVKDMAVVWCSVLRFQFFGHRDNSSLFFFFWKGRPPRPLCRGRDWLTWRAFSGDIRHCFCFHANIGRTVSNIRDPIQ